MCGPLQRWTRLLRMPRNAFMKPPMPGWLVATGELGEVLDGWTVLPRLRLAAASASTVRSKSPSVVAGLTCSESPRMFQEAGWIPHFPYQQKREPALTLARPTICIGLVTLPGSLGPKKSRPGLAALGGALIGLSKALPEL